MTDCRYRQYAIVRSKHAPLTDVANVSVGRTSPRIARAHEDPTDDSGQADEEVNEAHRPLLYHERHGLDVVLEEDARHPLAVLRLARHVRHRVLVRVYPPPACVNIGRRDNRYKVLEDVEVWMQEWMLPSSVSRRAARP